MKKLDMLQHECYKMKQLDRKKKTKLKVIRSRRPNTVGMNSNKGKKKQKKQNKE
jgi:hypothetical protein